MKLDHFDEAILPSEITNESDYFTDRSKGTSLSNAVRSMGRQKIVGAIVASSGLATVGVTGANSGASAGLASPFKSLAHDHHWG